MSEIIKINDWTLTKIDESTEPMITDLVLAEKLGYQRPRAIRQLIKRMVEAGQLGVVFTVEIAEGGATPCGAYHLTESQALKVIARSKTDIADKILDEVIAVYLAYRRGLLVSPVKAAANDDTKFEQLAAQQIKIMDAVGQMIGSMNRMMGQWFERRDEQQAPRFGRQGFNHPDEPAEVYDFPEHAHEHRGQRPAKQRALAVVDSSRPPAQDVGRWHWLAEIANTNRMSIEDVRHIVDVYGIPTRRQMTSKNRLATQTTDRGRAEILRHAEAMGYLNER